MCYTSHSGKGALVLKAPAPAYQKRGDTVPIRYKVDILQALKDKGYSTYRLRKEKIFAENTLQAFRSGDMVSYNTVAKLCELLGCDIGDILQYEKGERDN